MSLRFSLTDNSKSGNSSQQPQLLESSPNSLSSLPRGSIQSSAFLQSKLSPIQEHLANESMQHDEIEELEDVDQFEFEDVKIIPAPQKQKNIMVVTGQGGIDLDDVFSFDRTQNTQHRLTIAKRFSKVLGTHMFDPDEALDLYQSLPKWFAYYILGQSVFIGSIMVPWISLIPSDKMLRVSWRLMFQAIMLIPFVLWEFRNVPERFQKCYNFKYIFQPHCFSKLFIASLNTASQLAVQLFCFGWTHMSHVVLFLSMTNFWLSVVRGYKSEICHFVESGGRYMCFVGIGIIWFDSYTFKVEQYTPYASQFINNGVFDRWPWQRVFVGNLLPVVCAFAMSQLSKFTIDIKNLYPPFFSLFAINLMASIHVGLYSYFIDGTEINNDPFWGLFGLTQDGSFTMFMYISVILSLGLFSSSIFISKLYEPVIPASSAVFEPLFCCLILEFIGIQLMPSAVAGMGYLLIAPGQFLIIIGQHFAMKEKEYQDKLIAAEAPKPLLKQRNTIKLATSIDLPKSRQSTVLKQEPEPVKQKYLKKVSFHQM